MRRLGLLRPPVAPTPNRDHPAGRRSRDSLACRADNQKSTGAAELGGELDRRGPPKPPPPEAALDPQNRVRLAGRSRSGNRFGPVGGGAPRLPAGDARYDVGPRASRRTAVSSRPDHQATSTTRARGDRSPSRCARPRRRGGVRAVLAPRHPRRRRRRGHRAVRRRQDDAVPPLRVQGRARAGVPARARGALDGRVAAGRGRGAHGRPGAAPAGGVRRLRRLVPPRRLRGLRVHQRAARDLRRREPDPPGERRAPRQHPRLPRARRRPPRARATRTRWPASCTS